MKMLRLTIVFFLISSSLISQTKKETENWIISKFNKWKISDTRTEYIDDTKIVDYSNTEKPVSLTIIGCEMKLKTEYNDIRSISTTFYHTYSFDIGNIEEIKWVKFKNTEYLVIDVKKATVKRTIVYKENNEISYIDKCIISFKTDGEDDFEARMLKAFIHLRSFYPKIIKSREVF